MVGILENYADVLRKTGREAEAREAAARAQAIRARAAGGAPSR